LRPETRAFGERLDARFVEMTTPTSYWELFEELWSAEPDFIVLEEDVLPTAELVEDMWACTQPWCTGTYGRWSINASGLLWSDSQLGFVKFGSIRCLFPDIMKRAARLFPERHWTDLVYGLQLVGQPWTGFSPHLHLPHAVHLRELQKYDDPWDKWEDWEAFRGSSHVAAVDFSGLLVTTMQRQARQNLETLEAWAVRNPAMAAQLREVCIAAIEQSV